MSQKMSFLKIESIPYNAAIAITGAFRISSGLKLHGKLGFDV